MQNAELSLQQYAERWKDLNQKLRLIEQQGGGLAAALEALRIQQREQGFIKDDLNSVRRYRFAHPEDPARFFDVQYNPVRALRFQGSGRKIPPAGFTAAHDGCFLCPDNIQWQQAGVEMGYEIDVNAMRYIAWMNAYPLMPLHCVIASADHIPQSWCADGLADGCLDIEKILNDLVTLAGRLPGYVGFYNGHGAGASIVGHFHFQFFKRLDPGSRFPLEVTARKAGHNSHGTLEDYPATVVYWRGDPNAVVEPACGWIREWVARNGHLRSVISANIVSTFDDTKEETTLYFVPRHRLKTNSTEMSGAIGGIEVLGELVFSSEDEGRRLERGEIDYHTVERILASVRFD